jgi:hypothetical protein
VIRRWRAPVCAPSPETTSTKPVPSMSLVALLLLSSAASAGPPYITDAPEPTDYQHWELYVFSQGTHAMGETSAVAPPSCDCNYGIVPNVQLHIQPGMAFAHANGTPLHLGPGDTEFGVKYRFIEQDKTSWIPSVALSPLLEAPTGDAARGLGTGRTHAFVPLWIQKDFGDWTTFGGGGYWINPGPGNKNHWFVGWVLAGSFMRSVRSRLPRLGTPQIASRCKPIGARPFWTSSSKKRKTSTRMRSSLSIMRQAMSSGIVKQGYS